MMNIVFFGSSEFAVPSLRALIASRYKIVCVVTQPDRQKGRGLSLQGTPIKEVSLEAGLRLYQPQKLNNQKVIEFLKDLNANLFIVSAYGQILPQEILNIPKIFSINTHASLLPKYRGASPVNWAIINGDTITGVTIIKMSKDLDAGSIITSSIIEIKDSDTCVTLGNRLSLLAADLLSESLRCIENNDCRFTEQDNSKVSFAPKLKKEDGLIDWNKSAVDINNLIKGCLGWPDAFTYYKGKLLKIHRTSIMLSSADAELSPAGRIIKVSKEGLVVACGKDNLLIEELQLEGKKKMSWQQFFSGHKIYAGETLK